MARERITKQADVAFCMAAHDVKLRGFTPEIPEDYIPSLINEPFVSADTELNVTSQEKITLPQDNKNSLDVSEPQISEDILDLFREDQEKVPFNRDIRYHLLDDSIPAANPHCPAQIVEDDYSAESKP